MCGCIHGCTLSVLRNVSVLTLQILSWSVFLPYMKIVIYYYALITRLRPSIRNNYWQCQYVQYGQGCGRKFASSAFKQSCDQKCDTGGQTNDVH